MKRAVQFLTLCLLSLVDWGERAFSKLRSKSLREVEATVEPHKLSSDGAVPSPATIFFNQRLEEVEAALLDNPQIEMPLRHRFAPGAYLREIFMPAGTFVIGHEHKTRHFNIVLSGRANVMMNGKVVEIAAPCVFVSDPGVRKVLFIKEDMRWTTLHPNPSDETNIEQLEAMLVRKSNAFLDHEERKFLEANCPDYCKAVITG